jgi:hypothetical protein|tara:strand:- start:3712 stop:4086 length:375 start_codon:yes stop_codon:yes gene_type:complete
MSDKKTKIKTMTVRTEAEMAEHVAGKLQQLEEEVATYRNILYTLNLRQEAFRLISGLLLGIMVETRIATPGYIKDALRAGQLALAENGLGESNPFIEEFIEVVAAGMDPPDPILPVESEGEIKH